MSPAATGSLPGAGRPTHCRVERGFDHGDTRGVMWNQNHRRLETVSYIDMHRYIYSVRQSLEDLKEIKVGRARLIMFFAQCPPSAPILRREQYSMGWWWFFWRCCHRLSGTGRKPGICRIYIYTYISIYMCMYIYIYIIHTCHLISPKPDWDQVHERPNGYIQSLEMEHLPSPFLSGIETHPMKYWLVHRYSHCLLQQFLLNQGV